MNVDELFLLVDLSGKIWIEKRQGKAIVVEKETEHVSETRVSGYWSIPPNPSFFFTHLKHLR